MHDPNFWCLLPGRPKQDWSNLFWPDIFFWGALDAKKKVPCLLQVLPESEAKCVGVVSREGWFLLFLWCFCLTVWNYHESIIWFSCFCIALEGNQLNPGCAVRQQHCACAHVAFDIFLNACQAWARRHPSDGTNEKVKVFKRDFGRYVHSLASLAIFFVCFSDNPLIRLWVVSIIVLLAIVFAATIMV